MDARAARFGTKSREWKRNNDSNATPNIAADRDNILRISKDGKALPGGPAVF